MIDRFGALPKRVSALLPLLVALVGLFGLHAPYLKSWFTTDDPVCLYCAHHPALRLLFDRESYACFQGVQFTPLLPISFKLDWRLFGLDPVGAHLHNLLAAAVVLALTYRLLRVGLNSLSASLLLLLWEFSPTFTLVTAWATTRHYLWGLCAALLAVVFFLHWEKTGKKRFVIVALLFQLIAALWQGAYLSLPAVIFLLASGEAKTKLKRSLPFLGAAIVYLGWRVLMLGGLGGYPWVDLSVLSIGKGMIWSPVILSRVFFSVSWLLPLLFLFLGPGLGKFILLWGVVALPVSPMLPTNFPSPLDLRLFFPLSWLALWGLGQALQRTSALRGRLAICVLSIVSLSVNLPRSVELLAQLKKDGQEGRQVVEFLRHVPCEKVYLVGANAVPHWYVTSMVTIYRELLRAPIAQGVTLSPTSYRVSHGLIEKDKPNNSCGVFRYHEGVFSPAAGEIAAEVDRSLHEMGGPAPTLHGESVDSTLVLRWSPVEGADKYLVYYGNERGIYFDAIVMSQASFTYPNLSSGNYYFKVAARDRDGTIHGLSSEVAVTIP